MINEKTLAEFMNTSPTSLKEFSEFINKLIKEHGREKIITDAGIDKNVLYRASNSQNITLENYYKIKQAYKEQLKFTSQASNIEDLPILGQIIDNTDVRMLNPTQPISVPVPTSIISNWSPVFGYLCVSGTVYSGHVFVFSGKHLEGHTSSVDNKCLNRVVMVYPENEDPKYGMVVKQDDDFVLIHPRSRKALLYIPTKNNISWSKFICLIPYSLMENYKEPKYQDNIHKLEDTFHKNKV